MKYPAKFSLFLVSVALASAIQSSKSNDYMEAAHSFLPPRAEWASIESYDPKTGKTLSSMPAVQGGHVLSGKSEDLVIAYGSKSEDSAGKSLFIALLHKNGREYVKLFEICRFREYLWVQNFSTVGLQLVRLPGDDRDSIVLITSRGASLGAEITVWRWDDTFGLVNVVPEHRPAYRIEPLISKQKAEIRLSFQKYAEQQGVPTPVVYAWKDGRFRKNP